MGAKEKPRFHHFEFPGETGSFSIELEQGCFSDVDNDELYRIGKILRNYLYGLLLEKKEIRDNYSNIFRSVLKDTGIFIEDKDLNALLRFSNKTFYEGDYKNSLFLSQLVLAHINQVIDKKIANNDKTIDKEIIHLQISTLNFMGYLFSKIKKNVDYGIKLTTIANTLLDAFDEESDDTLALRAAILDTLGALYILEENWESAIQELTLAHEYDRVLLARGRVDEIGFRLTCSNLGYALVQKCNQLVDGNGERINISEIEENLEKAKRLFMMIKVDKPPPVPENHLKNRELIEAMKRMKQGLALHDEVWKKLQKRFL